MFTTWKDIIDVMEKSVKTSVSSAKKRDFKTWYI